MSAALSSDAHAHDFLERDLPTASPAPDASPVSADILVLLLLTVGVGTETSQSDSDSSDEFDDDREPASSITVNPADVTTIGTPTI